MMERKLGQGKLVVAKFGSRYETEDAHHKFHLYKQRVAIYKWFIENARGFEFTWQKDTRDPKLNREALADAIQQCNPLEVADVIIGLVEGWPEVED